MKFLIRGICLLLTLATSTPSQAAEAPTVNLMYLERPPFSRSRDGKVPEGLLIDPVEKAFQTAKIGHRWVEVPTVRQLAVLKANKDLDCGVGWFKRDERKAYAKYSKPFHQDLPTVGIVSSQSKLPDSLPLKDLVNSQQITWTLIDGFSYDPYVEKLLAKNKNVVQTVNGNLTNVIKMIDRNHASITFLAKQEAEFYVEQEQFKQRLKIIEFPDVPSGESRYLLCSFKVSDELLEKINKAFPKSRHTVKK